MFLAIPPLLTFISCSPLPRPNASVPSSLPGPPNPAAQQAKTCAAQCLTLCLSRLWPVSRPISPPASTLSTPQPAPPTASSRTQRSASRPSRPKCARSAGGRGRGPIEACTPRRRPRAPARSAPSSPTPTADGPTPATEMPDAASGRTLPPPARKYS